LPFTKENLEARYVRRRRASWLEKESLIAERSRNGFQRGMLRGFVGMALAGFTSGTLGYNRKRDKPARSVEEFYRGRLTAQQIQDIRAACQKDARPLHDALMETAGWPAIEFDGRLLVSHQDALLLGGKVQAPPDFPDHVVFRDPELCFACASRLCIEICSGEAIHAGENGTPVFDRDKCVHCGACLWNCTQEVAPGVSNVAFCAAPGGLHSAEN
jgi:electron-transferring-flavoprotein dehydrogenase